MSNLPSNEQSNLDVEGFRDLQRRSREFATAKIAEDVGFTKAHELALVIGFQRGWCAKSPGETPAKPLTLGRLILDTARGDVKRRTLSPEETSQVLADVARYYKAPLRFTEPSDDSAAPYIFDADGNAVAMLMWPPHPKEQTADAERATYALGRMMAGALPPTTAPTQPLLCSCWGRNNAYGRDKCPMHSEKTSGDSHG